MRASRFRRSAANAVAACLLSACMQPALINRRSGPTIEGHIDRSDNEKVYVTAVGGHRYTIERSDILTINHPGTARIALGIVGVLLGGLMLAGGLSVSCPDPRQSCEGEAIERWLLIENGIAFLAAGIPLAIIGGSDYYDSTSAATPPVAPSSTQAMRPSLPRLTCSFCPQ